MSLVSSVFVGLAIACALIAGADTYGPWLEKVETDFRDKLRRLRIKARNLRAYLLGWLTVVAGVFLVFWILWNMFVLGLVVSGLLLALPWYIVRRMAER